MSPTATENPAVVQETAGGLINRARGVVSAITDRLTGGSPKKRDRDNDPVMNARNYHFRFYFWQEQRRKDPNNPALRTVKTVNAISARGGVTAVVRIRDGLQYVGIAVCVPADAYVKHVGRDIATKQAYAPEAKPISDKPLPGWLLREKVTCMAQQAVVRVYTKLLRDGEIDIETYSKYVLNMSSIQRMPCCNRGG